METTRRNFVKGTAAAAGIAALGSSLAWASEAVGYTPGT